MEKFAKATGWKPRYAFDDSLGALLEHWRRETRKEKAALAAAR